MVETVVVELDEDIARVHRRRAEARGASLPDELRRLLTDAARPHLGLTETERAEKDELLRVAQQIRERNRPGNWPDTTDLLRGDRESR